MLISFENISVHGYATDGMSPKRAEMSHFANGQDGLRTKVSGHVRGSSRLALGKHRMGRAIPIQTALGRLTCRLVVRLLVDGCRRNEPRCRILPTGRTA